ncbi:MAG: bifunctional UDP-N-acetylglucosamine diphosphorylase/glucosamine-1-phosphate N-acetyltransferase GlmU [Micromonosporaceae bacterium]
MKSSLPKVLHPLLGRTLLEHVLVAAGSIGAQQTAVVIGHGADRVERLVKTVASDALAVPQERQLGTGHATRMALAALGTPTGTVVVCNGDVPLLRPQTLADLIAGHEAAGAAATIVTAEPADPTGMGRVVRHPGTGALQRVVEERDASEEQRAIREINVGVYAFDGALLAEALAKLTTQNEQGEEYLTDVVGVLAQSGAPVRAHPTRDATEALGCNDRAELAILHAVLRDRINAAWMADGVTIVDPLTTWIDTTVRLAPDVLIEPNTHLRGVTVVDEAAVIGPDTTLIDVRVGAGARVLRTHAVSAEIGPEAQVGPYAYLRPGTVLHAATKVGTFVEVKNSEVGAGTKIPHLSYVGDATIGEQTNIGAANVVVNYDGVKKHRTVIGSHVRTGSDTMLVAPVTVGDGAYTAAGSVIVKDVPPGALGVGRAAQRNIEGWVARRRAGTAAAAAAEAALAEAALAEGATPRVVGDTGEAARDTGPGSAR